MISSRERDIIKILVHAEKEITVKEIATDLGVSIRTVHRDLKNIEPILAQFNIELKKKSGVGLYLSGDDKAKTKLNQRISDVAVFSFSPQERQTVMLATLLEMKEPIKLFTFANELKVTEATISNDLDQLEEEIASFNLSIIRKRGYGVELTGKESDKRAALSHLIAKYVAPFEFVSLIKKNIEKDSTETLNAISKRLLDFINPERLQIIEQVVADAREELPYELADNAYIGLVVHLALAMERLQKGEAIEFDQNFLQQIEQSKEYAIAKKMIKKLEEMLHAPIPEDEIGYITMHLMGAKVRINPDYIIEESSIDIAFQAKSLIQYVSTAIGKDLTQHASLLHDLVAHLKPAIYRLQQNMGIVNPLINNIKEDYYELFQLIQEGVEETFPDMVFPEDEIGYLVLHFASTILKDNKVDLHALVICSSGIGTAKMLATKLMKKVPEVKSVDNKSYFDLDQLNLDTYDLIVSTIPLNGFEGKYIQTSPMLTNDEVHRIRKMVNQKKLTIHSERNKIPFKDNRSENLDTITDFEALHHYSKAIVDVLRSLHVEELAAKQSLETILLKAVSRLDQENSITAKHKVVKALQDRAKLNGLGIPGTTAALYHARSPDVLKPSFSIYTISHPIQLLGMDQEPMEVNTIILMLAPEQASSVMLEVFSYLSSLLIQDENSLNVFSTCNIETVKNYLSEQYRKFLLEKNLL